MTIPLWVIPTMLTIIAAILAVLWPVKSPGGDYAFGAAFEYILHLAAGVFSILVIWLVFFIII